MTFGHQAVLPIDVHYCTNTASLVHDKQLDDDEVEVRMLHQRKVLEVVKMNIAAAQTRQKVQYDRKHYNPDVFEPGSIVLKKDFRRKKCAEGKQDFTWLGPYRIVKSLGRGLYRIVSVDDSIKIISRVHGVHLKQYRTPKVDGENEIIDGDVDDQDSREVDGDSNEATFRDSRDAADGSSEVVEGDSSEAVLRESGVTGANCGREIKGKELSKSTVELNLPH